MGVQNMGIRLIVGDMMQRKRKTYVGGLINSYSLVKNGNIIFWDVKVFTWSVISIPLGSRKLSVINLIFDQ